MKLADIFFAATLTAMLLASIAAVIGVDRWGADARRMVPVIRLEPIIITGTKARAAQAADVPCVRSVLTSASGAAAPSASASAI